MIFNKKNKFVILLIILLIVRINFCYCKNNNKLIVKKINIEGNEFLSDRSIKKSMLTKESRWYSRSVYYEDLFEDDLKSISQLYHNLGFLDVNIASQIDLAENNEIALEIIIAEGSRTFIDSVIFENNDIFSDKKLNEIIKFKNGEPFNKSLLEKDNYALLAFYAENGYLDVVVKPELKRNQEQNLISIIFRIKEGINVKIKSIKINGLENINRIVVERELLLKPGMVCNYKKMLESQHRMYQSGLFSNVSIKPVLIDSTNIGLRDLQVNILEKERGEVNFGLGFGSYEKFRGSFEIFQKSLMGSSHQIGTQVSLSSKNQRFEFSYTNRWLFGMRVKYDLNTFFIHQIEPNYEMQGGGIRATLGKTIYKYNKITVAYKYQDLVFSNVKDTSEIKDQSRGNTRSLLLNYFRDTRDSQFNTTLGSYYNLQCELAGGFLQGTNTFVKAIVEARKFYRINQSPLIVFAVRIFTGFMQNYGQSNLIPLNERFYAGGENSIRGYSRRQVGPKISNNIPVGGKITQVLNCEFRFPIYKKFGGTLFYDAGNVWKHYRDINLLILQHGIGYGLRYNSPLGIVRIDFGLKVDPDRNEKLGEIFFTLGQIF